MRNIISVLGLLLLSACASSADYEAKLNRWIGASERDLVTAWGVPDKQYQIDGRTKMLAYVDSRNVSYPGTFSTCLGGYGGRFGYSNCIGGVPPSSESYTCETTFMLTGGKVSKWGHKGSGCRTY